MRPVGMACNLRFLPRRQPGIDIAQHFRGFGLEPRDVVLDVERGVVPHVAQFGDLPIERGDLFFEIQKGCHAESLGGWRFDVNSRRTELQDRKSTRLNLPSLMPLSSSVLCLTN